ncbi:splicing factor 3B subunit 1-like [Dorcoceras hygrometricum]|uniref:Splicing factor 3B subunit 1-like n=1 Tax=Dorcoceras hygrometricum TaxID=472368 RepID=A0A2Z7DCN2_9LAMI|nr:splicing factor 3B subunit 1-like [Dorcoceras hygrometricum]
MASFTAPKQFLKEPLRPGENDDISGSKQPSKIIEPAAAEKDKEIEPVATENLSLAKIVATMTDSEDTEPLSKVLELTEKSKSDEDLMSIKDILKRFPEDMMLPSVTAAEITIIKFGRGIAILGVSEGDWYKVNLPHITISDKGKAPLVEKDEIKGHPAREMFSLICADIDFLVQLREKILFAKEEQILAWAETDSLETAVRRWEYIIAKYREMLLRKFLEAHRKNFRSSQPTTAIDLQIIDLLSDAHLFAVETLQTQMRIHELKSEWMCSSSLFEGESIDRGAVIARSNMNIRSSCWIRTMILADICIEVVQFSAFGLLQPVGSHNFCRALVVRGTVRNLEVDPTEFCGVFRRGLDIQLISSDSSSSSIHPDPTESDSFSQRNPDTGLNSPSTSTSDDSRMLFTTDDIPLGDETAVDHILMPTTDIPATYFTESFAQLRASVTQLSIKQMRTKDSIGDLKNQLL